MSIALSQLGNIIRCQGNNEIYINNYQHIEDHCSMNVRGTDQKRLLKHYLWFGCFSVFTSDVTSG